VQPNLKAATKFDGSWSVTLDAKVYKNPDGSTAQPFVRRFPATVKNGVFHGEIGNRGKPEWLELNGKVEVDGTADLRADLITGSQKWNFTQSRKAPPREGNRYSYQVVARFHADAEPATRPMAGTRGATVFIKTRATRPPLSP
jgi:hypothetical protein